MDMHPFQVTVIGNGGAMPAAGKYHSAHAVNIHGQFYLTDCGEGTQKAMLEQHIPPQKLKAIFISHLHADHIYGLFPLLDTISLSQRKHPLQVFAPAPLKNLLDSVAGQLNGGRPYPIEFHPVDTTLHQVIYENGGMEVVSIPLKHRVPSAGYLFREKPPGLNIRKACIRQYSLNIEQILAVKRGEDMWIQGEKVANRELAYPPYTPRSYAYCTDTVFSAELAGMVQGVDLLYHEATFSASDSELARANGHSTTVQAARIASQAHAGKLLIGHFSGRYKNPALLVEEAKSVFPATEEAVQGKTYEIPPKKH